ncbi:winged helix-turn-helix domain-containing protein, partial [Haliangium sp.]|uniref:winged helix-turn-helix domain-containing protein n=1 Tax=Haliangium sp. TaxID=2663208 RepID=UPI003D0B8D2B
RAHRRRGDEIGGIAAEHALAALHLRRGDRSAAAECARAARRSATRLGLQGLAAGAAAVEATLDALDLREDAAAPLAALVRDPAVDATGRHTAAQALDWYLAATGQPPNPELLGCNDDGDSPDDLAARLVEARVARARGKQDRARKLADEIASRAERGGRRAELAHALNLSARLALARGQRSRATAAATRAAREAEASGLADALIESRLVLASLALAEGRTADAVDHARAGADLAARTGLNLLRAVAIEALSALDPNTSADDLEAARATLSAPCIELAGHLSADLGLSAARPYCLLTATGARTRVADTDPARLRLDARSLVIDRVHEVILRDGNQIADLRRRSLLKRLLYLFAAAPGRSFSKETIVETVWEVEYHPLRHDAALFTNIMRARRLLGEDGAEIIRVSDDGYRLAPPDDFLYIEAAQDQSA